MRPPLRETVRVPLEPEEHAELGRLIREAETAQQACAKYCSMLGTKYSVYAQTTECSVGFENGVAVISEPSLVFRAS